MGREQSVIAHTTGAQDRGTEWRARAASLPEKSKRTLSSLKCDDNRLLTRKADILTCRPETFILRKNERTGVVWCRKNHFIASKIQPVRLRRLPCCRNNPGKSGDDRQGEVVNHP